MARTRTRTVTDKNNSEEKKGAVSDRRRRTSGDAESTPTQPENGAAIAARKDRATPSQRQGKPRKEQGLINRIPIVRGIAAYFRGVMGEMQKVTWPSREETIRLTWVVLGVTIAFAIVLGILDTFLTWWFTQAFSKDSEMLFLGIAAIIFVLISGGYVTLRNRI